MATAAQVRARRPNQQAMVSQLADYGETPIEEPLPPPAPVPAAPVAPPPPPPAYTPRVNPDGSVEAPEPGEVGYVAPGAAPPSSFPVPYEVGGITGRGNGNTLPGPTPVLQENGQPLASAYGALPGFDTEKLNGTKPYDSATKYSDAVRLFSRAQGAGVPISRGNLGPTVDYAKANGFPNALAVGDDKIDWDGPGGLPPDDLIRSDGLVVFQHGSDGQTPSAPTSPPLSPVTGTLPPPVGTTVPAGTAPASPVSTAFQDALVKLLGAPDPTLNDPALKAQSQANAVAQQRSAERRRAVAAEQRAAGGQMGGALEGDVDNILSAQGDAVGAFDAGLLGDAQKRKDANVIAALGPALAQMGLDQQSVQFILNLAQNDKQFLQRLGLDKGIAEGQLNLQSLIAMLNGLG